jgi:hypothetical protein
LIAGFAVDLGRQSRRIVGIVDLSPRAERVQMAAFERDDPLAAFERRGHVVTRAAHHQPQVSQQ